MNTQFSTPIKPVLAVVTSNAVKGKSGIPTGFWLSELTHPLAVLQDAGIPVELASIQGGQPPVDGMDLNDSTNARYWNDTDFRNKLANTLRLADVDSSRYSAIFFAGGHGTMWDFPESPAVRRVVREIWEAGGIVSAVCHGPAALVNVVLSDGNYLVTGKQVSAFTDEEEKEVQATDIVPFLLASTLNARGAKHHAAPNWAEKVVVDGRLITGQNPTSAGGIGRALRDLLKRDAAAGVPHSALSFDEVSSVSPALVNYTLGSIVGDLWKRTELSPRDRSIITLSALIGRNGAVGMLHYFNAALDSGLKPAEVSEIITQLAFYAGWPNAFSAIAVAKEVFAQRGIGIEQLPAVSPNLVPIERVVPEDNFRLGFIKDNVVPISPGFAKFTNDLLYHEVWRRPDLSPRDRSLATVACMIACGDIQFLELYLNRAMGHGLTKTQVGEMLTQLAFYIGWPKIVTTTLAVKGIFDRSAA